MIHTHPEFAYKTEGAAIAIDGNGEYDRKGSTLISKFSTALRLDATSSIEYEGEPRQVLIRLREHVLAIYNQESPWGPLMVKTGVCFDKSFFKVGEGTEPGSTNYVAIDDILSEPSYHTDATQKLVDYISVEALAWVNADSLKQIVK
jgi:hypothetical protein